jgi:hypothetical protein
MKEICYVELTMISCFVSIKCVGSTYKIDNTELLNNVNCIIRLLGKPIIVQLPVKVIVELLWNIKQYKF